MRTFTMIVERDPDTGLLVGSVPGWPGAHSQAATLDELQDNLRGHRDAPGGRTTLASNPVQWACRPSGD